MPDRMIPLALSAIRHKELEIFFQTKFMYLFLKSGVTEFQKHEISKFSTADPLVTSSVFGYHSVESPIATLLLCVFLCMANCTKSGAYSISILFDGSMVANSNKVVKRKGIGLETNTVKTTSPNFWCVCYDGFNPPLFRNHTQVVIYGLYLSFLAVSSFGISNDACFWEKQL